MIFTQCAINLITFYMRMTPRSSVIHRHFNLTITNLLSRKILTYAPCRSASVGTRHDLVSHFLAGSSPISSLSLLSRGANPLAPRRPLVGCCYVMAVTYWATCIALASLLSGGGFCIFRQTNRPRGTSSLRLTYLPPCVLGGCLLPVDSRC